MGSNPKFLDDMARVAGGAVNILSGMQQQIREEVKSRVDELANRMDLVPREDLDDALAMIAKLRTELGALEKRVSDLEGSKKKTVPKKAAPKKTTAKKTAAKKKTTTKKTTK